MGTELDTLETLRETPITELNIATAKFKRKLKNAGLRNIVDAFELPASEIDEILDFREADEFDALKQSYLANPEGFARSALANRAFDRAATDRVLEKAKEAQTPKAAASHQPKRSRSVSRSGGGPRKSYLPDADFAKELKSFEERANSAFEDLLDRGEETLAFEAFPYFPGELDQLAGGFKGLFSHYANHPKRALGIIEEHFLDSFIVFTADRARALFDGENLWGNLFDEIGMGSFAAQADYKKLFVRGVERRGMPLYCREDQTFYYLYTTLLHGGLSGDSWEALWEKSLIPAARATTGAPLGGFDDALGLLRAMKSEDGRFQPKKSVMSILEKVPESTLVPIIEEALSVARQAVSQELSTGNLALLTESGLPDTAMKALATVQSRKGSGRSASGGKSKEYAHFAKGDLVLDLTRGEVIAQWSKQEFPSSFAGRAVDYLVDGEVKERSDFELRGGKCLLPEVSIPVPPKARYDIELRLMIPNEGTGELEAGASVKQVFQRSKPGCFEFFKSSRTGLYRMRRRRERITKTRRVAYIVKDGYYVDAGPGMSSVEEFEAIGQWENTGIYVFDVEPGASGAVRNEATHEEVAVWQENYAAQIKKPGIIGETADGRDLYGFLPSGTGTNGGLPTVLIDAANGFDAIYDLEAECTCDGQRVSVARRALWGDSPDTSDTAQIAFPLGETMQISWHVADCDLVIRQKSSGLPVFHYRFAIAPLQDFHLESATRDFGVWMASYRIRAREEVLVTNMRGETAKVSAWGWFDMGALLSDEYFCLRIEHAERGLPIDAKLALAAIDVQIPKKLAEISDRRSVCLADVINLGDSNANVQVRSIGSRHMRSAYARLGEIPLMFEDFSQPRAHEVRLFREAGARFVQGDFEEPRSIPLVLTIVYGTFAELNSVKPYHADIELLRCSEGIGIADPAVVFDGAKHSLQFEGTALCEASVIYERLVAKKRKVIETARLEQGSNKVEVPAQVIRLLDVGKEVTAIVVPHDFFGDENRGYAFRIPLERKKYG